MARENSTREELLDEIQFWVGIAGEAIDALDACADDDEDGWGRQQHAESESARISDRYRARYLSASGALRMGERQ